MEFGQIPQLNEFQAQSIKNLEIVDKSASSNLINSEKESNEVLKVEATQLEKSQEIKVEKGNFSTYNEVKLTNLNFGYNDESKDFFVKVKRGDVETQYPTDDMMRIKAYLMSANEKATEENSPATVNIDAS